jgi:hypothetical protein
LVGLTFAWAGNANALLQSREIEELSERHPGGYTEYVFTYQAAILAILSALVAWGFAGLQFFDKYWPTSLCPKRYFLVKTVIFALSSMSLRECWHVVLGAQWMLIIRRKIRHADEKHYPPSGE